MKESVSSVLPIALIVLLLCLFTIGADLSMTQIGSHIGAKMTNTPAGAICFSLPVSEVAGLRGLDDEE